MMAPPQPPPEPLSGESAPASPAPDLAELARTLRPQFLAILRRYQIPSRDAEDLIQETFLIYLYKAAQIARPAAWLCSTLRNRCRMYWRRSRLRLEVMIDPVALGERSPSEGADQERWERAADLEVGLASLDPRHRAVLMLRHGLGESAGEVAPLCGYSPASIRKVASRARLVVARRLRALGFTL